MSSVTVLFYTWWKPRRRDVERRPQIPVVNPMRLSLLTCFITTVFRGVAHVYSVAAVKEPTE